MVKKKTVKVDPVVILNDNFQVVLDPKCLVLRTKILDGDKDLSKEEQKEGQKVLGYFSTWESLGSYLLKYLTREKAIKESKENKLSMEEFLRIINECNKEIKMIFKDIDEKQKIKK